MDRLSNETADSDVEPPDLTDSNRKTYYFHYNSTLDASNSTLDSSLEGKVFALFESTDHEDSVGSNLVDRMIGTITCGPIDIKFRFKLISSDNLVESQTIEETKNYRKAEYNDVIRTTISPSKV
jgi:hypothetical protein